MKEYISKIHNQLITYESEIEEEFTSDLMHNIIDQATYNRLKKYMNAIENIRLELL